MQDGLELLLTEQQPRGGIELFVVLQAGLYHAALIVVGRDDVHLEHTADAALVLLQVGADVVRELGLKGVELLTGRLVVALKLGRTHQLVEVLAAQQVVLEPTVHHAIAEDRRRYYYA